MIDFGQALYQCIGQKIPMILIYKMISTWTACIVEFNSFDDEYDPLLQ